MFGKGVYLADISSKSAGYCAPMLSGGVGLLLLCEAELGKPMLELTDADYNAEEEAKKQGCCSTWGRGLTVPAGWKDAGCVREELKGVLMVGLLAVREGRVFADEVCSRIRGSRRRRVDLRMRIWRIMSISSMMSPSYGCDISSA